MSRPKQREAERIGSLVVTRSATFSTSVLVPVPSDPSGCRVEQGSKRPLNFHVRHSFGLLVMSALREVPHAVPSVQPVTTRTRLDCPTIRGSRVGLHVCIRQV